MPARASPAATKPASASAQNVQATAVAVSAGSEGMSHDLAACQSPVGPPGRAAIHASAAIAPP